MTIYYILILSCCVATTLSYSEIGEACHVGTSRGVCKLLEDCKHALYLVREQYEDPDYCFFEDEGLRVDSRPVVCCPGKGMPHVPTGMRDLFDIESVIRKSKNMTCYLQEDESVTCCENEVLSEEAEEPERCPPLPMPKLNDADKLEHPAWTKCLEYQRYFNKCVSREDDPSELHRVNTCGMSASEDRIYGGKEVKPREFPHMAVIGRNGDKEDVDIMWTGGGSLISDKFVLTAAHVVYNKYGKPKYVLLGTINKINLRDGLLFNIIQYIVHSQYKLNADDKRNDIALVELHQRVKLNEFIRPACLPVPDRQTQTELYIAGWGQTQYSNDSLNLLYAKVNEDKEECLTSSTYNGQFDKQLMICAKGSVGVVDACQGDSGGPLMKIFSNLNCSYSVEGVISFGASCAVTAGIYTRVEHYMDWIMSNVWPLQWGEYKATYMSVD